MEMKGDAMLPSMMIRPVVVVPFTVKPHTIHAVNMMAGIGIQKRFRMNPFSPPPKNAGQLKFLCCNCDRSNRLNSGVPDFRALPRRARNILTAMESRKNV